MSSSRRTGLAAFVAAVLAAVLVGGLLAPATAANDAEREKRRVDSSVRQLREAVHESSARLQAAERQFHLAEARLPAARAGLADAQRRLAVARSVESDLAGRLHAALAAEAAAAASLRHVIETLGDHRTTVGQIARRTYQTGTFQNGSLAQLRVALAAQTPQEFAHGLAYLQTVMRSERTIMNRLGEQQAELARKRARLEAVRRQVAQQRAQAAEAVAQTRALERQAAAAAGQVEALVAQRRAAMTAAERERAADQRRYREMQAESQRLARLIRAQLARDRAAQATARAKARARTRNAPAPTWRSGGGWLSYPVDGPITSPFGMRYHPILHYAKLHTGTDFGVPSGAVVRAARAGTVIQSYYNGAYGNRVVVNHGYVNGVSLVTTYNHLSRRTAFVGERVSRGEVLGHVGSTGYSTGPHLHFETLQNGSFVNPMRWL